MADAKAVIDACGLFPSELLDSMTNAYFTGEAGLDFWLTFDDGSPAAIAYCTPERMTEGTWNLLLIAVHPGRQSRGYGAAIMRHIEKELTAKGARLLIVETSGLPSFEGTRAFYRALGYDEVARIREFYRRGEDKIIFCRILDDSRAQRDA